MKLKIDLFYVQIIIIVIVFNSLVTAANTAEQKSYCDAWARYILADIMLGGSVDYYKGFPEDPNSSRAVKWYGQGIKVINIDDFERIQWEDKVCRLVFRGTSIAITGSEIKITTDLLIDHVQVRYILADLALGAKPNDVLRYCSKKALSLAQEMISDHVTVTNLNQLERKTLYGNTMVAFRGTGIKVNGTNVVLSIDRNFYENEARYMLADIYLGGPVGYYRDSYKNSRDPNIQRTLFLYDNNVKITNIGEFERKIYPDKRCVIVYKGTDRRMDGNDAWLTSDRYSDAEVRYKLADVMLGAPLGFYRADSGNATNKIMFRWIEKGVRILNICDFERKRFTDRGMLVVYKGTSKQITGKEIMLSSDIEETEGRVRLWIARMQLKENFQGTVDPLNTIFLELALERIRAGERIYNINDFILEEIPGEGPCIVHRHNSEKADGMSLGLDSDTWYDEGLVRIMLSILWIAGDNAIFDRVHPPSYREAVKRKNERVKIMNLDLFDVMQVVDGKVRLVYKGSDMDALPEDIELSTDRIEKEYRVRNIMLQKQLGLKPKLSGKTPDISIVDEASKRIQAGEKIINATSFEAIDLPGRGLIIVNKGTQTRMQDHDIALSTDHVWSEGQVRYIMADIALGGPLGFYKDCVTKGDPIAGEPVTRWENGIRVDNVGDFERKYLPELGCKIVYKCTTDIVDPMDIKLTGYKP